MKDKNILFFKDRICVRFSVTLTRHERVETALLSQLARDGKDLDYQQTHPRSQILEYTFIITLRIAGLLLVQGPLKCSIVSFSFEAKLERSSAAFQYNSEASSSANNRRLSWAEGCQWFFNAFSPVSRKDEYWQPAVFDRVRTIARGRRSGFLRIFVYLSLVIRQRTNSFV